MWVSQADTNADMLTAVYLYAVFRVFIYDHKCKGNKYLHEIQDIIKSSTKFQLKAENVEMKDDGNKTGFNSSKNVRHAASWTLNSFVWMRIHAGTEITRKFQGPLFFVQLKCCFCHGVVTLQLKTNQPSSGSQQPDRQDTNVGRLHS